MRADAITVGAIYRFQSTVAAKVKIHFCVAPCLFFLVNTEPSRRDGYRVTPAEYPAALSHDSFVDCSRPIEFEPEEEIIGALPQGTLSKKTLQDLIQVVRASRVLAPNTKDAIVGALLSRIGGLA